MVEQAFKFRRLRILENTHIGEGHTDNGKLKPADLSADICTQLCHIYWNVCVAQEDETFLPQPEADEFFCHALRRIRSFYNQENIIPKGAEDHDIVAAIKEIIEGNEETEPIEMFKPALPVLDETLEESNQALSTYLASLEPTALD